MIRKPGMHPGKWKRACESARLLLAELIWVAETPITSSLGIAGGLRPAMRKKENKMIIPVTCGDAEHIELDKWIKHIRYESSQPGISASRHLNMPNVAKRMPTPHADSCLAKATAAAIDHRRDQGVRARSIFPGSAVNGSRSTAWGDGEDRGHRVKKNPASPWIETLARSDVFCVSWNSIE